ncbi:MAG: cation transporter [Acidobacteria bacterium]|nr:cation transporter [Acidobacteriota bacterium]
MSSHHDSHDGHSHKPPSSVSKAEAHRHDQGAHGHLHGTVDPTMFSTKRGIWAVKWAFVGLLITSAFQLVVVYFSGSVALLADTIHNLGDAATAVPLWIAFSLARRSPSKRFTYGYGRSEDLAGVAVVLTILASAVVAGYESVQRLLHPQPVSHLWAVMVASLVGFLGNEGVAIFRIKVGKEIGSAALVADGYHARVDGFTSLAVLLGTLGVWLAYPLADPLIGLLITVLILRIVWESAVVVFTRLLDGVDPAVVDQITIAARRSAGVEEVSEVRVRWLGHRLHAELNLTVAAGLSVEQGHDIATQARHTLLHNCLFLSGVTIHIDPANASGEAHHHIESHSHDDSPVHSH